jgi:hypothetical protein
MTDETGEEEPDWDQVLGGNGDEPKSESKEDAAQKKRVANAKKKKKPDYIDLAIKIVLFPIVLASYPSHLAVMYSV